MYLVDQLSDSCLLQAWILISLVLISLGYFVFVIVHLLVVTLQLAIYLFNAIPIAKKKKIVCMLLFSLDDMHTLQISSPSEV